MAYFPFFVDIEDANGLVVGGGKQALGKVVKLIPYGAKLHVITSKVMSGLEDLGEDEHVKISCRDFCETDLEPCPDFVIIACDDKEERNRIARLCKEKRILVNSVDDIENCGFVFPSLVRKGKLSIGITTSGASPVIAMDIKKHLQEWLPDNIEETLEWMELIRPELKAKYPDEKERAKVFRAIYESMVK